MRRSLIIEPAARVDDRTPKLQIERPFAVAPKQRTRTGACYIEPPRKLWDRIVLFMFVCCLFVFLHAFFGFGVVDEDPSVSNDSFVHSHAPLSISPWNRGSAVSNEDRKMWGPSMTRVMVDWHGNCELLPSTASPLISPATIPQDAFPDPTPILVRTRWGPALDEGSLSMTTKVEIPMNIPSTSYETPYDPFQLVFENSVDGGEVHGLYPVARPPRTTQQGTRTRRFGRICRPGPACL